MIKSRVFNTRLFSYRIHLPTLDIMICIWYNMYKEKAGYVRLAQHMTGGKYGSNQN